MTGFNLGDKVKPKGRHFAHIIYVIRDKSINAFTGETLYTLESSRIGMSIIDISEDSLIEKFTKI